MRRILLLLTLLPACVLAQNASGPFGVFGGPVPSASLTTLLPSEAGTIAFTSDQGALLWNGTAWVSAIATTGGVTASSVTTLTDKTISSASNTLSIDCNVSTCANFPAAGLANVLESAYVLRAKDYGIAPTHAASVNDTGFAALKTAMQANSTTVWRLIFEPTPIVPATITASMTAISATNSFVSGQPVIFVGNMAGITGLTASSTAVTSTVTYYVIATGLSSSQFEVSATPGGSAITPGGSSTAALNVQGLYAYTNNRQLFGVRNVIWEAFGSVFQNTVSSAWAYDLLPLVNADIFNAAGDVAAGTYSWTTGYLFNTAVAGATQITTTTAADAGNFAPGTRIMIMGYDQQGIASYPPNLRYYESNKTVLTANASTGVITFASPLQYGYDSRWFDTQGYDTGQPLSFGKPRVMSMDVSTHPRAHLVWIRGGTYLNDPNASAGGSNTELSSDILVIDGVEGAQSFSSSVVDQYLMRDSNMNTGYQMEFDKLCDSVVIDHSVIDGSLTGAGGTIVEGTGCHHMAISRTKVFGYINAITPRQLTLDDDDIIPLTSQTRGVIPCASYWPVQSVTVSKTRIYNTGGITKGVDTCNLNGITFTVGAANGTDIIVANWNGAAQALSWDIDIGTTLSKSDGSKTGVVTAIYNNASTVSVASVAITGTAGQFSCTCTALSVGQTITITGTYGGTGSITGYASPAAYLVSATNGTSTFTLQTLAAGAIVTTTGTPTGLTYAPSGSLEIAGTWSAPVAAESWVASQVQNAYDGGGNSIVGVQVSFWNQSGTVPLTYASNTNPTLTGTIVATGGSGSTMDGVTIGGTTPKPVTATAFNFYDGTPFVFMPATNPTISSGFGTSPQIPHACPGTASCQVQVGTGGSASTGVVALPTGTHLWACFVSDGGATPTGSTEVSAVTNSSVTFTNYSRTAGTPLAWTANEILTFGCIGN